MTARLVDVIREITDTAPDRVALWDGHDGVEAPTPMTFGELMQLAARLVAAFERAGVGEDDAVGVWLPNWSSAVAAQLAASAVGAHVIGINTRYNTGEVAHVIRAARPRALLVADEFNRMDFSIRLAAALDVVAGETAGSDDAARQSLSVLVVSAPGAPAPGDVARFAVGGLERQQVIAVDLAKGPLSELGSGPAEPGRLGAAFTTSGSTGRPKLAAHTETAAVEHSLAAGARMAFVEGEALLGALPLSGVFGFNASYAALVTGTPVLLEPVFSAPGTVADMAGVGVTHVVGADDLIGRIAVAWRESRPPLALRWVGFADFEGRSGELADWAEQEFGAVTVGVYGSSELFALTTFWNDDDPQELRRAGGGRLSLPAAEVRVADPITGAKPEAGTEGEIQFRGPNVVDTYLGDDDGAIAAASFTDDGWFHSGDLGVFVEPRTVRYVCRMGDVLRLRGFLVDPAEVEHRLIAHDDVCIAKVVGVAPEVGGTVAVAFVVPVEGASPDPETLRAWCAETLAPFKVPTRVKIIETMPVTTGTNGTKIRAAALRDQARELLNF